MKKCIFCEKRTKFLAENTLHPVCIACEYEQEQHMRRNVDRYFVSKGREPERGNRGRNRGG